MSNLSPDGRYELSHTQNNDFYQGYDDWEVTVRLTGKRILSLWGNWSIDPDANEGVAGVAFQGSGLGIIVKNHDGSVQYADLKPYLEYAGQPEGEIPRINRYQSFP